MNEKFEQSHSNFEEVFDPLYFMRTVAEEMLVEHGGDEAKAMSFVGDLLSSKGIDNAFLLHRFDAKKQQTELLGILDNPSDEEEIKKLFSWEEVPEELKSHYGLM